MAQIVISNGTLDATPIQIGEEVPSGFSLTIKDLESPGLSVAVMIPSGLLLKFSRSVTKALEEMGVNEPSDITIAPASTLRALDGKNGS